MEYTFVGDIDMSKTITQMESPSEVAKRLVTSTSFLSRLGMTFSFFMISSALITAVSRLVRMAALYKITKDTQMNK